MTDTSPNATYERFLRELSAHYREARAAHDRLVKQPTDTAALLSVRDFFHWTAGAAREAGLPVLGHLATVCEKVSDLPIDARGARVSKTGLLTEGLAAVAAVLESPSPVPSSPSKRAATTATDAAQAATLGEVHALSKVLVVVDDPFATDFLDGCLRSAGFLRSICCPSSAALQVILEELPDLILLDGIDGSELCRHVREHPALRFTPIIFLTHKDDLDQRARELAVGGNDYLLKPFEPHQLVDHVRTHLQRVAELSDMATRDGLTRCYNHKYFKERMEQETARALRHGLSMAVAMFDVDKMKAVNEKHGRPVGDSVLAHLASLILASVRSTDVVARYSGEQFAVIFVHSGAAEAEIISARIRERIAGAPFELTFAKGADDQTVQVPVTVSAGIAQLGAGDGASSLIQRADATLNEARALGRNQMRITRSETKR